MRLALLGHAHHSLKPAGLGSAGPAVLRLCSLPGGWHRAPPPPEPSPLPNTFRSGHRQPPIPRAAPDQPGGTQSSPSSRPPCSAT
ncbi:hypothetical protein NDU88_002837 [Pleurodeles waltl]|uniref:Uncharacterized protein n=1 Tax=Pleurodeles waltl TaxID=8319 RepID=A0AAV7M4J4_PLEWA|nr:hypothetical protein NDU88_002837 [Pleurodeles waltl]